MKLQKSYLEHKETLRKHGKFMLAGAILSLVGIILFLVTPCFKAAGIYTFSMIDEIEFIVYYVKAIIDGKVSLGASSVINFYSVIISITILIGIIRCIIATIKIFSRLSNGEMYVMEEYDKLVRRMENKKEKGSSNPWDMFYATISEFIVFVIMVRLIFNSYDTSGIISYIGSVSNLVFLDGVTFWGILVGLILIAVIVINFICSFYLRKVKKSIIKEEYDEKQALINELNTTPSTEENSFNQ